MMAFFCLGLLACGSPLANKQLNQQQGSGGCNGYTGVFKFLGAGYVGGAFRTIEYNGNSYQISGQSSSGANAYFASIAQPSGGNTLNQNVCFTGTFTVGPVFCDYPNCGPGPVVIIQTINNI